MSAIVSDNVRAALAQSLILVRQHKDQLIESMEIALRGTGGRHEAFGQSEVAAMLLVELLLDQARILVERGQLGRVDEAAEEHRALDIDGRHYSRFGDALVPILSDLLGPGLPPAVPAAWCDAFWALVGAMKPQREAAEA